MMSTLAERFQILSAYPGDPDVVSPSLGKRRLSPQTSMWPERDHDKERPALTLDAGRHTSPTLQSTALTRFDAELRELTEPQQRVLRLMLTGARIALVAGAAGESRRAVSRWVGAERVYLPALRAVQRDLDPTSRARLHGYVTRELMWENDEALDAEAWATLAVIRALGRLDAETNLLEQSVLRATFWSTTKL